MFFRIKKIKGKEYAYIVENSWKRGGSRQKVRSYLGGICRLDLKNSIDFFEYSKIENVKDYALNNGFKKIIWDLVAWELYRVGVGKDVLIDAKNSQIQKGKKNVVLLINEGFMCGYTLQNLTDFKPEDEENDKYRFARAFVETGIKVPEQLFVELFGKLYEMKGLK